MILLGYFSGFGSLCWSLIVYGDVVIFCGFPLAFCDTAMEPPCYDTKGRWKQIFFFINIGI
jgi:hypothetical protein